VSPRGDYVAIDDQQGIALVDRAGSKTTLKVGEFVGGFAWSRRGDALVTDAGESNARRRLRRVTLKGAVTDLYSLPGTLFLHDLAGDGRVLLHHGNERWGDLARPAGAADETEVGVSSWSYVAGLSADGSQVLLNDAQQIPGTITLFPARGGRPLRLGAGAPLGLSADGRWVLVERPSAVADQRATVTLMPTGAGDSMPVAMGSLVPDLWGPFGIDQAWHVDVAGVGFWAAEPGRPRRSFFVPLPGGQPKAVTPEGVLAIPALLPGGSVVGVSADGTLALYPVAGGDAQPLPARLPPGPRVWALRTSSDGRFLFVREGGVPARISRLELATGRQIPWKTLRPRDPAGNTNIFAVTLTPDGEGYAYTYGQYLQDLFLVDGLPD
jgi:hypothetical protein